MLTKVFVDHGNANLYRMVVRIDFEDPKDPSAWIEVSFNGAEPNMRMTVCGCRYGKVEMTDADSAIRVSSGTMTHHAVEMVSVLESAHARMTAAIADVESEEGVMALLQEDVLTPAGLISATPSA